MSLEMFLFMLMVASVLTGLFTEAIKKLLDEGGIVYRSNVLAGIVSAVVAVLISAGYVVMTEAVINAKLAVVLIALVLLSWLCAMVGYDKVIQAISQFKVHTSKQ